MKDQCFLRNSPQLIILCLAKSLLSWSHSFAAVLILSVLLPIGVHAQTLSVNDAPHVEPQSEYPEIYMDIETLTAEPIASHAVELRTFGMWRMACTPTYMAHTVVDNTVHIFAVAEPADLVCGQPIEPWGFVTPIKFDAPGKYNVHVFAMSEQQPDYQMYATTTIDVGSLVVEDSQITGNIFHAPANPSPDDAITMTVRGINSDACVPMYNSHSIDGDVITIEASKPVDMVCGQVETPWSWQASLGTLDAGIYSVDVYVSEWAGRVHYETSQIVVTSTRDAPSSQQKLFMPTVLFR